MRKRITWLITIGIIASLMLIGCSSKSSYTGNTEMAVNEEMKMEETSNVADKGEEIDLTLGDHLNRKVIKTGEITIETKAFESTINNIFEKVKEIDGFIERSYIEGNRYDNSLGRRNGEVRVRIPNKAFDQFINQADTLGNVVSRSIQGKDVTDAYVDTEARLKSLEVQRERLMELLEKSGTLEELFAIEKEVANVNYEIEQFKGTLNKYDSLIEYATVQMTIEEVRDYQNTKVATTFGEQIANKFMSSLKDLKNLGEGSLLLLVGIIPFVVVIGIPVVVVAMLVLAVRRKLSAKKEEKVIKIDTISDRASEDEDKNK